MARPLGRYTYYSENVAAPPKPETDEPKPDDEADDDGGKPARMPTSAQRVSAPKKD